MSQGGAGLSDASVKILLREEIKGTALFKLTDAKLVVVGMPLGAREDLLAAVALLCELPGECNNSGACEMPAHLVFLVCCSEPSAALAISEHVGSGVDFPRICKHCYPATACSTAALCCVDKTIDG